MKSIWDAGTRKELTDRITKQKHNTPAQWGKMNAGQMVAHVTDPLRAAMGEMSVTPKNTPFRIGVLRYLIIYVMPWPKGAPTAPEFIHEGPEDLVANVAAFRIALDRFASHRGKTFREHAAFGPLSEKDWGCLTWRHLDHHLRQFGL